LKEQVALPVQVGYEAQGEAHGAEAVQALQDIIEEGQVIGLFPDLLEEPGCCLQVHAYSGALKDPLLVLGEEVLLLLWGTLPQG
jgi:hypothetical protein